MAFACQTLGVARSSYYHYREQQAREVDADRLELRAQASRYFNESRGSAGSRTLRARFAADGVTIGRFKVRRLMREANPVSRQPRHAPMTDAQVREALAEARAAIRRREYADMFTAMEVLHPEMLMDALLHAVENHGHDPGESGDFMRDTVTGAGLMG